MTITRHQLARHAFALKAFVHYAWAEHITVQNTMEYRRSKDGTEGERYVSHTPVASPDPARGLASSDIPP